MATSPKIGRHLTPLELATLKLWLDGSFNFEQWRDDPPDEIIALRDRYLAAGAAGLPPTIPPVVATAAIGDAEPGRWDELFRLDIRFGAVVIGLILAIAIFILASVAVAIVP